MLLIAYYLLLLKEEINLNNLLLVCCLAFYQNFLIYTKFYSFIDSCNERRKKFNVLFKRNSI